MTPLSVIIGILVISFIAPFIIRRQNNIETWATVIIVNLVIISLFYIVRTT